MTTKEENSCHQKRIAIYPGTFDPITMGHVDIINRASKMFDEVIVTIGINATKTPLFSIEERMEMIRQSFPGEERISVETTSGLMIDFARKKKATVLVRGLRAVSDFDYEFQVALANRKLNSDVESVFLMTSFRWIYISSSLIKDIAQNNGDVSDVVPPHVEKALRKRFFPDKT